VFLFKNSLKANTSEKSVNFYQNARRSNPEGSQLHNRRREKLKFHKTSRIETRYNDD
jgi:hypothetical protein